MGEWGLDEQGMSGMSPPHLKKELHTILHKMVLDMYDREKGGKRVLRGTWRTLGRPAGVQGPKDLHAQR